MDQLTEPATLKAAATLILLYKVALPLLSGIYAHFLRPGKKLRKYGRWAVVTGATDVTSAYNYTWQCAHIGVQAEVVDARRVELADVLREGPPFFDGLVAQAEVPPPIDPRRRLRTG